MHLKTFIESALQGTDAKWTNKNAARKQAIKKVCVTPCGGVYGTEGWDLIRAASAREVLTSSTYVLQGARDNIMPLYVIHELDAAITKMQAGNLDAATGAPHNWDEGYAFYYGAQDENACGAPFNTVADRASDFNTMDATTNSAQAHNAILAAFQAGLTAIQQNNAAAVQTARDTIVKQLRIPYLQVDFPVPNTSYTACVDIPVADGTQ